MVGRRPRRERRMTKRRYTVPGDTAERQARASDPQNSVWVSANAGSGKTHVLSQRVIRLLLEGTDPSKILCLTYTRAAAANMSNRVFSNLSEWTMLGDSELAQRILEIEGREPGEAKLRRARKLCAEALETPGGLKIQTIHAFCESVLHQFALEANIAAHFEMLDPQMEELLFAEARREMLTGAVAAKPGLAEAFAVILERGGEFGLDVLLQEIVRKRDGLRDFIDRLGGDTATYAELFEEFGFASDETAETIAETVWPVPGFSPNDFETFHQTAILTNAKSVMKNMLPALDHAFREHDPVRRLKLLAEGFLKSDGDPYKPANAFTRALQNAIPDLAERYRLAVDAIVKISDRLALFRMLEGTRAALTIADWLIARYEQLKS